MEVDRQLWQDYRGAWEAYLRKHAALQCLIDSVQPENARIEAAALEVERARAAHSAARDRLARHLSKRFPVLADPSAKSDDARVRSTARLLWEMSGRPDGTAESDWLSAETLVKSAAHSAN